MAGHAKLSPSSSSRWLTCPGSVRLSEGLPDTSSTFADEGSDAHELAALCLTIDTDTAQHIGKALPNGNTVGDEMAQHVQAYLDYVRALEGEHHVESWLDLSHYTGEEGGGGTADHIAIGSTLSITDLKYGRGAVGIEGNTQLRVYATGAIDRALESGHDVRTVRLAIFQPRISHEALVEVITVEDLNTWINEVLIPGAAATRLPDAPLVPSDDACKWCKAKSFCPALASYALEVIGPDATPPAPSSLAADTLSEIASKADLIRAWLDAAEAEVLRRLHDGQSVPNWKLVQGRKGNRAWVPAQEDNIAAVLRNNYGLSNESIFKLELQGPATLLKLPEVKANPDLLAAFIVQRDGALTAAPASDKRPAILPDASIEAEFSSFN